MATPTIRKKIQPVGPGEANHAITQARKEEQKDSEGTIERLRRNIINEGLPEEKRIPDPVTDPAGEESTEVDPPSGVIGDKPAGDGTSFGGKRPEAVVEKPPVAVVSPEPSQPGDIETDEQIEARHKAYVPQTRDQQQFVPALKKEAKAKNELARAKQAEVERLTKELEESKKKVLPEEEVTRLRDIENRFNVIAVDQLPKWKEYDTAISKIGEDAVAMLREHGVAEPLLKVINEKRGGLIQFMNSDKPAGRPGQWKNADGSDMTESDYFHKHVFSKLNPLQQAQFGALTKDAIAKQREKETALTEARSKAGETIQQNEKMFWERFNKEATDTLHEILPVELPKINMPLEIPIISGTETPEEKAQKEGIIADWQEADKAVQAYTKATTAKDRVTLAVKGALWDIFVGKRYPTFKKDYDALKTEVEELRNFKSGIKEARKLSKSTTPQPKTATPEKAEMNLSTEEALDKAGFRVGAR